MRYISTFSGIEAASVAWEPLGWTPVGFSEIEPFASAVLAHRFPGVTNYGDITKHAEWDIGAGAVDLLVGGSPCQAFSVAGLRRGLDDPRGQLTLVYLQLAARLHPEWIVWENVPGVLSADGGRAFGAFLGGLEELGYGWAYRILDARHFGVPQRRRRVFLVARRAGDWQSCAKVLLEPAGLPGNPPSGGETWQAPTRAVADGARASGSFPDVIQNDVGALCAVDYKGANNQYVSQDKLIVHPTAIQGNLIGRDVGGPQGVGVSESGTMYTLTQTDVHAVAYRKSRRAQSVDDHETWVADDTANTLNGFDVGDIRTTHAVAHAFYSCGGSRGLNPYPDVCPPLKVGSALGIPSPPAVAIPIDGRNALRDPEKFDEVNRQGVGVGKPGDPAHTVTTACVHAVAIPIQDGRGMEKSQNGFGVGTDADPSYTIDTTGAQSVCVSSMAVDVYNHKVDGDCSATITAAVGGTNTSGPKIPNGMVVRRLTPVECERLQGFPDKWTDIPYRGKPATDGPRYKALGNSMAVPCMAWIGKRIQMVKDGLL